MNVSTLHPEVLKKLGFIKYLYNLGVSQSVQPRPINTSCLLTFHDAVENFMTLACTQNQIKVNDQPHFNEYFSRYEGKIGKPLLWVDGMRSLNKRRRDLKHDGVFPSDETIVSAKVDVSRFFEANTPTIFDNIPFESLSMRSLVSSDKARNLLRESEDHKKEGQLAQAVRKCAGALHILLDEYRKNASKDWDSAVFDFGNERTVEDALLGHNDRREKVGDFIKAYSRMSDALIIIGFGIDYRKYAKFMMIAPGVSTRKGSLHYARNKDLSGLTTEEFQFCYDFIIETALKLQEFAIDPDALSTTRTAKKAREWDEEARRMRAGQERAAE